jgi:hypothetical protein
MRLRDSTRRVAPERQIGVEAPDESECYEPSTLFDGRWYLRKYADVVATGMNPLVHYVRAGAVQGRDPHPLFSHAWYLQQNPEVAASKKNPLLHYLQ